MSTPKEKLSPTFIGAGEGDWVFSAPGVTKKILRHDPVTEEVTLLIRFEPDAHYPAHDHPGGEEIYALEGDAKLGRHELGAGDYLFTPPGGKHAVYSKNGCLFLLVLAKPIVFIDKPAVQ